MAVNHHPEAQWFKGAGIGLMLHWGIASIASVDLSWGMIKDKPWDKENRSYIPAKEYWKLAERFNPDSYNPDKWLAAAREAGMEYAVLTTKHHDGYALWPSEYGNFGVKQYLNGRDLVGEYVDACRRQGLKVGFYFSLADWRENAGNYYRIKEIKSPAEICYEDLKKRGTFDTNYLVRFERYYKFVKGQIKELITRYGKIDLLWFDGGIGNSTIDDRLSEIYNMVRTEQPHIVINGRGDYSELGDYKTPECELPEGPIPGWWEICQSWHYGGWGYHKKEQFFDIDWTLELLAKTVGWGGNLLLNIGPRPNGELPHSAYESLELLKEWMHYNRSAVKGAERGPWPPRCSLPITRRVGTWYIHILKSHSGPIIVKDIPEPAQVSLLRNQHKIEYSYNDRTLNFEVSDEKRVSGDEVVAITWHYATFFREYGMLFW